MKGPLRPRRLPATCGRFVGSLLAAWILGAGCAALPNPGEVRPVDAAEVGAPQV